MLSNLDEVNVDVRFRTRLEQPRIHSTHYGIKNFSGACKNLQRFCWNGSQREVKLNGSTFNESRTSTLTELYLDDTEFRACSRMWLEDAYSGQGADIFMLKDCPYLERLSIKNARYYNRWSSPAQRGPVTQGMLIKVVRHLANLQWFRSDLSEENIVMLQQERPSITFVSE
jgi:hypothetical protein